MLRVDYSAECRLNGPLSPVFSATAVGQIVFPKTPIKHPEPQDLRMGPRHKLPTEWDQDSQSYKVRPWGGRDGSP